MPTNGFKLLDPPRAGTNQKGEVINPAFYRDMSLNDYLVQLSYNMTGVRGVANQISVSAVGERMSTGTASITNTTAKVGGYVLYSKPIVFPTAGAIRLFAMTPNLAKFNTHIYMNVVAYGNPGGAFPFVSVDVYQYNGRSYVADEPGIFEFSSDLYTLLPKYSYNTLRSQNFGGSSGINSWTTHWIIEDLLPSRNYRFIPRFGYGGSIALPSTANYELVADPVYLGSNHPARFDFSVGFGG